MHQYIKLVMSIMLASCGPNVSQSGDSTLTDGGPNESTGNAPTSADGGSTSTASSSDPGSATQPSDTSLPSGGTASDPSTTGGEESDSADPSESDDGPGGSFIDTGGGVGDECSLWDQDCTEGEKCMPWASDGGVAWNATRCSPIAPDPDQPGEPCTVEGSPVSGVDTCDIGSMCWEVDQQTNEGECVAFCIGDEANPSCANPDDSCTITSSSVLILCLPSCDPLDPQCSEGQVCVPAPNGEFFCVADVSGSDGAAGDSCESIDACDPGLLCLAAEAVPGCESSSCCTAYCDLQDETPPCPAGQSCVPLYEQGSSPPGSDNVGYCGVEV